MTDRGSSLELARALVASCFAAIGRGDLAQTIREGGGDDFPEVTAAADVLAAHSGALVRYEEALLQYADHGLWDEATPGGPLALHDGGQMARNVLGGRPAFFHRD